MKVELARRIAQSANEHAGEQIIVVNEAFHSDGKLVAAILGTQEHILKAFILVGRLIGDGTIRPEELTIDELFHELSAVTWRGVSWCEKSFAY